VSWGKSTPRKEVAIVPPRPRRVWDLRFSSFAVAAAGLGGGGGAGRTRGGSGLGAPKRLAMHGLL